MPVKDDIRTLEASGRVEVPQPLSEDQIRGYVDDGYVVVPGLITQEEIDEMKADIVRILRGGYSAEDWEPSPEDVSDEDVLGNILCVHQVHYVSPVMKKYVRHPRICGVLSQTVGAHLPFWDGSVKCMQSMFFVKPPGFQGQAWHQDEIYIPTRDRSLAGAWIALDDATEENGCLWILPGSHRTGFLYPQEAHNQPDEFDSAAQSYGFDDSGEISVEVEAGSVVFFNGYLLHRSRKNQSNITRQVLVNHYCNAWSLLPWHLPEGVAPARADVRAIELVSGIDPYAWKGTVTPPRRIHLRHCKTNQETA